MYLERVYQIEEDEIHFDNYIEFERDIEYEDEFAKPQEKLILEIINKDFKWNIIFKIINSKIDARQQ